MPTTPRVIRVVVGLLLGCVLGVVLAGSTGFQWDSGIKADLGNSYCCDTNAPSCSPIVSGGFCTGGIYADIGSCQTSCKKPVYCCNTSGTGSLVCQPGSKNVDGSSNCLMNGGNTYDTLTSCGVACKGSASSSISSSSSSDTPYCGCETGTVTCVPATAQ